MSSAVIAFLCLETLELNEEKIERKYLRDRSNPLTLPESLFVDQYRLNKDAFMTVLNAIEPHLQLTSIPTIIQLAATLRYLAEGSYQRSVRKDSNISVARSAVSEILSRVLPAIEKFVCPQWVKLNMTEQEKQNARDHCYNKFKIPGIIGCIDGTHIKINKPTFDEHLFFHRKGYFSMNAMIICDFNMMIRAVDARYPGSSHDSFVWNISSARQHFLNMYQNGERACRLLGDSGYGIEPFLLTPYRNPLYGSREDAFNKAHCSTRNVVERTIGVLKSRFGCLMSTLHYCPEKVVTMVNVCAALHNICRSYKIEMNDFIVADKSYAENCDLSSTIGHTTLLNEGQRIRDEISNSL